MVKRKFLHSRFPSGIYPIRQDHLFKLLRDRSKGKEAQRKSNEKFGVHSINFRMTKIDNCSELKFRIELGLRDDSK